MYALHLIYIELWKQKAKAAKNNKNGQFSQSAVFEMTTRRQKCQWESWSTGKLQEGQCPQTLRVTPPQAAALALWPSVSPAGLEVV